MNPPSLDSPPLVLEVPVDVDEPLVVLEVADDVVVTGASSVADVSLVPPPAASPADSVRVEHPAHHHSRIAARRTGLRLTKLTKMCEL
jgi:hypothetical protein